MIISGTFTVMAAAFWGAVLLAPAAEAVPGMSAAVPPFRFAATVTDNMVLQAAPMKAMVWGFCPEGASVSVSFNGTTIPATIGPDQATGNSTTWRALLPATAASFDNHSVHATSAGETIAVSGVMFGEVWVCSGQSNMEYTIGSPTCWNESNINCTVHDAQCTYGCVNQSGTEIKAMADYDGGMRLFTVGMSQSAIPLADVKSSGWQTPSSVGGKFSAACWFFGRDVYAKLSPKVPVGLIETNVGGTPDEHWSSPDALARCKGPQPWNYPANFTDSVLWNAMVVGLLRSTVRGAIWYQGERNTRVDGRTYNCSFPAMISDWRAQWNQGTDGATAADFPFGWAQLNSDGPASRYLNPPSAGPAFGPFGEWSPGFPSVRLAQANTLSLPSTFQAVILDTPVASGSVHSPYKQPVGQRLARGGLAVAYGISGAAKVNPVPVSATVSDGDVEVTLSGLGTDGIQARQGAVGFELLGKDAIWHSAPIKRGRGAMVVVGPAPAGTVAVRYLFYPAPCGLQPYQCPVYTNVEPIGQLSGEQQAFLPLGPFVMPVTV